MITFLDLFKPAIRQAIQDDPETNLNNFYSIVAAKDLMPYDSKSPNFNTQSEINQAQRMIKDYEASKTQP